MPDLGKVVDASGGMAFQVNDRIKCLVAFELGDQAGACYKTLSYDRASARLHQNKNQVILTEKCTPPLPDASQKNLRDFPLDSPLWFRGRFQDVLQAFATLDHEGRVSYANEPACQLLACGRDQLLGQRLWGEPAGQAVGERLQQAGRQALDSGEPAEFEAYLEALDKWIEVRLYPFDEGLALHLHDTRGTALANITASLEEGVRSFDSAVGGLGGCPYAPGASGNVATEDLVSMLHGMGVRTGIDLDSLVRTSLRMEQVLGRMMPSRVVAAMRAAAGAHDVERVTP
jgi:PAS domain-containing protein